MPYYTVRLEVEEERILYCELENVEAPNEDAAIKEARKVYKESGRREFLVDVGDLLRDNLIVDAVAIEKDE